jgi:hypothetical protein
MSEERGPRTARFVRETAPTGEVFVHFNPASLLIEVSNTLPEQGEQRRQYTARTTAKLTVDLVFDSTDTGTDVRQSTKAIIAFMDPSNLQAPPVVRFDWGAFSFSGMIESYKETIEFFSNEGVPLRSTVNLILARQDMVFEHPGQQTKADQQRKQPVDAPRSQGGRGVNDAARAAGDEAGGRQLATANQLESMRFPSGPVTVDPEFSIASPAAFASAGAGLGISGGAGVGVSGGAGIGISGGAGLSASAGAGAGVSAGAGLSVGGGVGVGATVPGVRVTVAPPRPQVSGRASAGVSASAGAFNGLSPGFSLQAPRPRLDAGQLTARGGASIGVSVSTGASFSVGGQAGAGASAGLSADVGAGAAIGARLQFDD